MSSMFRVEGLERAGCEPTGIRTPLGVVVHTVTLDRYVLPDLPCAAWRLPTGARLYRRRDRAATVAAALAQLGPRLTLMWAGGSVRARLSDYACCEARARSTVAERKSASASMGDRYPTRVTAIPRGVVTRRSRP